MKHEHCYNHEHEHEHCCDNEHEHEHEHEHINEDGCEIIISTHDQSYIASYKFSLPISKDKAKGCFGAFISLMCRYVEDMGGIIGHIKAIVRFSEGGLGISATDSEGVDFKKIEGEESFVEGVAIVFGVDEDELIDIVLKSYKKISKVR